MDFNIMTIRGYGEMGDPYLYPVIDEEGHFIVEQGDHSAAAIAFNNVKIMRNAVVVFESEHALDGRLFITDSRVVLLCEDYESGNIIWVGGLVGALIASAASDAMARSRTSRTVLCGHIRYEWLDDVAATSERYLLGLVDETVVITYRGKGPNVWSVTVSLKDIAGVAAKTRSEIERRHALFKQGPLPEKRSQARKPHQLPEAGATHTPALQYCSKCGGKIRQSDAYCKHCGAQQTVS